MQNPDLKTNDQLHSPLPWLLRTEDVAELCQVSSKTVQRAIRSGRLPAYRLGKRNAYRIRPDDVEAWLQSSRVLGRASDPASVDQLVLPLQPRERGRLAVDDEEVSAE
jgi:excisionase family DNA binding protein